MGFLHVSLAFSSVSKYIAIHFHPQSFSLCSDLLSSSTKSNSHCLVYSDLGSISNWDFNLGFLLTVSHTLITWVSATRRLFHSTSSDTDETDSTTRSLPSPTWSTGSGTLARLACFVFCVFFSVCFYFLCARVLL